jgi:hypothetical protein
MQSVEKQLTTAQIENYRNRFWIGYELGLRTQVPNFDDEAQLSGWSWGDSEISQLYRQGKYETTWRGHAVMRVARKNNV